MSGESMVVNRSVQVLAAGLLVMGGLLVQPAAAEDIQFERAFPNMGASAWSPDGTMLAASSGENVVILDSQDGDTIRIFRGHSGNVQSVGWSPDGSLLASGGFDGTVRIWDVQNDSELEQLACPGNVNAVAWSPDGDAVASASSDGSVVVWEVSTGTAAIRFFENHTRRYSVDWSNDGTMLAVGGLMLATVFDVVRNSTV